MSGPYECQVRLYRDALSTPWGFRLQGGKDFKQPLSVQRVFVGSPADGELSRGDVILSINNYDAAQLLHKQAQDIIKEAGGSVDLTVKRAHPGRPTTSTIIKPALPASNPATPQGFRSRPAAKGPVSPQQKMGTNYAPSFGVSYSGAGRQPAPTYMLNRIQENLNQAIYSGAGQQYEEDDEPHRSVGELKTMFVDRQPPPDPGNVKSLKSMYNKIDKGAGVVKVPRSRPRQRPHQTTPSWVKPDPSEVPPPKGLQEPGWTPYGQPQPSWAPVRAPQRTRSQPAYNTYSAPAPPPPAPAPLSPQRVPQQQAPPQAPRPPPMAPQQVPHIADNTRPAWTGTLKSSGGPKPWEVKEPAPQISGGAVKSPSGVVQPHQPRVQTTHFGPGGNIEYKQSPQGVDSDHARIQHLQYNTPIGLYSKENVEDVLRGQTSGMPGDGTLQVTGGTSNKPWDPTRSDVLRMVHEEDCRKKRGGGPPVQSARYEEQAPDGEMHYHGYQDQSRQSRSMQALQANFPGEEGQGTSDF